MRVTVFLLLYSLIGTLFCLATFDFLVGLSMPWWFALLPSLVFLMLAINICVRYVPGTRNTHKKTGA